MHAALAAVDGVRRRGPDRRRRREGRRPAPAPGLGRAGSAEVVAIGEAAVGLQRSLRRAWSRSRRPRRSRTPFRRPPSPWRRPRAWSCSRPPARAGISSPGTANAANASRRPRGRWRGGLRWLRSGRGPAAKATAKRAPAKKRRAQHASEASSAGRRACADGSPSAAAWSEPRAAASRRGRRVPAQHRCSDPDRAPDRARASRWSCRPGRSRRSRATATSFWYFQRQSIYAVGGVSRWWSRRVCRTRVWQKLAVPMMWSCR